MSVSLPPSPPGTDYASQPWRDWFTKIGSILGSQTGGSIAWTNIDFTGSDMTDVIVRRHVDLQSLQGGTTGEYYHLTSAQLTALTAGFTGTGNLVRDTSPTITTPSIVGTSTNDNAAAGSVGEYVSSTVLVGAQVALTTATAANVTSISLTAGDWDVFGTVAFNPAAGTLPTILTAWTSATSATLPTLPNSGGETSLQLAFTVATTQVLSAGRQRVSIAGTTTIYLSAQATFTVSTLGAYGFIGARRVR